MEYKVYQLSIEIECKDVDIDMCPTTAWENIYENTYASKIEAIRQAQRRFAKLHLNSYVLTVHATVMAVTISNKGKTIDKRVYNLYKELEHNIFGTIKQ